jgi:uncharacterized protein YaaW (UPF0174 family)
MSKMKTFFVMFLKPQPTLESRPVDELRLGLELATEEELQALTEMLFRPKFNPLDYMCSADAIALQSQGRHRWLDTLEERFRFLAADGVTVLQRKTQEFSYRSALVQICRYLKIPYTDDISTVDLEAEIFLSLMERAWKKLPAKKRQAITHELQDALSHSQLAQQLPPAVHKDPIGLVLKGSSALAVTSVIRPWLLQQLARQFALHAATYQAAKQTLVHGGVAAMGKVQTQVALQTASRGMAMNAARYGAVRTVFAFLGPALWAWFFADLGWRAIATNYSRIIPVVFTLAQIRLTRDPGYSFAYS